MSKRLSITKKPFLILATIATAISIAVLSTISSADVSAWGPERTTYTNAKPASYAVFNSITDNVALGDERNFVRVREAGTNNTYVDELEVVPGKEYEVYIYFHNDAASNTNSTGYGVATDVRAASAYPTLLNPGERGMVSGFIYWSYVTPADGGIQAFEGEVWDEAYLTTKTPDTVLRYKTGTAVIHNAGEANGSVLSTSLFTKGGTHIGFNKLSGVLPGCAEYSGYITYTLVAESTTSELTKEVSLDGENWSNSVTVEPGDYVTYRVTFKNTGNTTMANVIFKDEHSDDLTLRYGSTVVFDYNHTSGKEIDDIIDLSGYNVGDVAPGALVQIIYQMRVNPNMENCGSLYNAISVDYNGGFHGKSVNSVEIACQPGQPSTEYPNDCSNPENSDLPSCVQPPCELDPTLPGCNDDLPESLPNTGPVEIVLAAVIVLGIAGGAFYLWRTQHTLRTVENKVSGKSPKSQPPVEKLDKTDKTDRGKQA